MRVVQWRGLVYVEENEGQILTETPSPRELLTQPGPEANAVEDSGQTVHAASPAERLSSLNAGFDLTEP